MEEQDGILFGWFKRVMVVLFGSSWRTSLFGALAFLSEGSRLFLDYLVQIGISEKILHGAALFFGLIAIMNAKDGRVTGGQIQSTTSSAEPKKEG